MDDYFDRFEGSPQDNFELAALRYFEELDRQAGEDPRPAPPPEPAEARPAPLVPDEDVMPDLADSGLDSIVLSLMADPVKKPRIPRPVSTGRLTRPAPRKKPAQPPETPAPAAQSAPLSDLAKKAAGLFDTLPTEDQLLAYSLLQKLAKAAEKDQ